VRVLWQVILDFAADNVVYLELRTSPKVRDGMTKDSYVGAVLKGMAMAQAHLRAQQTELQGRWARLYFDVVKNRNCAG